MTEDQADPTRAGVGTPGSLADLFLAASQQLAQSDARIYRSVDRHLRQTRELLNQEEAREESRQTLQPGTIAAASRLLQGEPSYERQPRGLLESLCRKNNIRGYSRMNKEQMIACLKAKHVPAPPVPLEALTKAELLTLIKELTAG